MPRTRAHGFLLALFAAAIVAVYANGLTIDFQLDDAHTIAKNPYVRSLASIPRAFWDPTVSSVFPENRDLRPILFATLAANYAVSGYDTSSYHLVNLLLHWLAVVLVFRIVRDHLWLGDEALPVAVAAALVVAVHPLNSSAVNYVSARSALLTTVFYLGAFDAAVRRRQAVAVGLFALALLTKAIASTLPAVLLAYWLLAPGTERWWRRPPWTFLGILLVLDAALGFYRWSLLPASALEGMREPGVTPGAYFITGWSAYVYYLRLFLWPNALVIDRKDFEVLHSVFQQRAYGSLALLVALGALAWRARARWPILCFAFLWFVLALAAESTLWPLAEPVNEHRPYLAMLGLGAAAGLGLWRLAVFAARRFAAPPAWLFAVLLATTTSALGAATVGRNQTWRDAYTLWTDATEKAPENFRAWLNAGHAAMTMGNLPEARRLLGRALELHGCYPYTLMNLSVVAWREGDREESLRWADHAVACNPRLALAHYHRAWALRRLGRADEALAAFHDATARDPGNASAWFDQGSLLKERGAWAEAAAAFDRAFEADFTRTDAAIEAGVLYNYRLHKPAMAAERYRAVLDYNPTHYGAHYQLAVALLAGGRQVEALAAWQAFLPLAEAAGDRASIEEAPDPLRLAATAP